MRKNFAHSKQAGGPAKAADALAKAYIRTFTGADAEMVLADLAARVGYYDRPSYSDWMKNTGTPHGFELHSALCNARAEVVQRIMGFLTMDEDRLIALEKAAREER